MKGKLSIATFIPQWKARIVQLPHLKGCLHGGDSALSVGLVLVKGLNFTSILHGNFLALLAGMDLVRMRYRRASPSEYVYMENFSPLRRYLAQSIARSRLAGIAILSCKWKKKFTREFTGRRDLGKKGQPYQAADSLPCKHHLNCLVVSDLRKHANDYESFKDVSRRHVQLNEIDKCQCYSKLPLI